MLVTYSAACTRVGRHCWPDKRSDFKPERYQGSPPRTTSMSVSMRGWVSDQSAEGMILSTLLIQKGQGKICCSLPVLPLSVQSQKTVHDEKASNVLPAIDKGRLIETYDWLAIYIWGSTTPRLIDRSRTPHEPDPHLENFELTTSSPFGQFYHAARNHAFIWRASVNNAYSPLLA